VTIWRNGHISESYWWLLAFTDPDLIYAYDCTADHGACTGRNSAYF
jgi:hypothetical protein